MNLTAVCLRAVTIAVYTLSWHLTHSSSGGGNFFIMYSSINEKTIDNININNVLYEKKLIFIEDKYIILKLAKNK